MATFHTRHSGFPPYFVSIDISGSRKLPISVNDHVLVPVSFAFSLALILYAFHGSILQKFPSLRKYQKLEKEGDTVSKTPAQHHKRCEVTGLFRRQGKRKQVDAEEGGQKSGLGVGEEE